MSKRPLKAGVVADLLSVSEYFPGGRESVFISDSQFGFGMDAALGAPGAGTEFDMAAFTSFGLQQTRIAHLGASSDGGFLTSSAMGGTSEPVRFAVTEA